MEVYSLTNINNTYVSCLRKNNRTHAATCYIYQLPKSSASYRLTQLSW